MTELEDLNDAIASFGRQHQAPPLDREDLSPDPFIQFRGWLEDAIAADILLPNTMALATAPPDGRPSVRMVLLKGFDSEGLVFFTNYTSRKALELDGNPHAAVAFYWSALERQVRIEGPVHRVEADESDAYFVSRPRGSRIGAWASAQSRVIPDRAWLDQRYADADARYPGEHVPRPAFWGGYRIVPVEFEFWQGRPDRMHDRWRYRRGAAGWEVARLAP